MAVGKGRLDKELSRDEIIEILQTGIPRPLVEGKKVLVLTPDSTRTAPLPLMVMALAETIGLWTKKLDFMAALGTHAVMSEPSLLALYGIDSSNIGHPGLANSRFLNHRWDLPGKLECVGIIPESEIERLTEGLFRESVEVLINKDALDYDLILILGPVFPHEVVGFSGGNKYLFPGISGGELLNLFHWLGALRTSLKTIGIKKTSVRAVIDYAASLIPVPRWCLSMVVSPTGGLTGLFAGETEDSWSAAADLSSKINIVWKKKPFKTVLGIAPDMYNEMWVGGKVMYKLEPVIEDGGTLILYGPHIKEVSFTWGEWMEKTGYHVRDYFLKQWDLFKDFPGIVLAHSTHVRGAGTYIKGIERPRIELVLATGIPEEMCRKLNLGYMAPHEINIADYTGREESGILVVEHAGEVLYRIEDH